MALFSLSRLGRTFLQRKRAGHVVSAGDAADFPTRMFFLWTRERPKKPKRKIRKYENTRSSRVTLISIDGQRAARAAVAPSPATSARPKAAAPQPLSVPRLAIPAVQPCEVACCLSQTKQPFQSKKRLGCFFQTFTQTSAPRTHQQLKHPTCVGELALRARRRETDLLQAPKLVRVNI